ncbi:hypothetical protein GLYMA_13G058200v4 [Glycine max]|uniref:Uncharacterized protein n=1 Tax=Glycine max TaxID=3847 RepID=A0A0R0GSS4_SOYBN|nr:hypothetical protein GYH30_035268 [Glycine max]KRH18409.1 hypothetical protein GLYMA_13G058200v4 [Glycine max]
MIDSRRQTIVTKRGCETLCNIVNSCMFRNLTKILYFHSPMYRGCPLVLLEETDFIW